MPARAHTLPTLGPLEIQLLQLLWSEGSQTARQAYEVFRLSRSIAYTTIAKTLDRLVSKGLLHRDLIRIESRQALCYSPRFNRSQLITYIVERTLVMLGADQADHQHLALALRRATFTSPNPFGTDSSDASSRDL